jgi:hypothetical protein
MTLYKNNWTEADLYKSGYHATGTWTCKGCDEEVTRYESSRTSKKLFLISDMSVHQWPCGEGDYEEDNPPQR